MKKMCANCQHWTDERPKLVTHPSLVPYEGYKYCAVTAWCENWQGPYQVGLSRFDSVCPNDWKKKTNQLELKFDSL